MNQAEILNRTIDILLLEPRFLSISIVAKRIGTSQSILSKCIKKRIEKHWDEFQFYVKSKTILRLWKEERYKCATIASEMCCSRSLISRNLSNIGIRLADVENMNKSEFDEMISSIDQTIRNWKY